MSGPEVLDTELRSALESVDRPAPPAGALEATRHAAKRRIRRRRLIATVAVLVVAAPVTGAVLALGTGGSERVATVVDDGEQVRPPTEAPLPVAPLSHAWLIDEPLPPTERIEVINDENGVMSVSVSEEGYLGTRHDPDGSDGSGSSLGDAETTPALAFFASGPGTSEADDLAGIPGPVTSITGKTRAEIVYLELTTTNGTWTIPTVAHPALPQLRFFTATGDFGPFDSPHPLSPGGWSLVGFGSDGQRLIDWAEVTERDHRPWPMVEADGIPAELPPAFLAQLEQLAAVRVPGVMVPTWLPEGLIGVSAEATDDGYQLRFESPDGQRAVSISDGGTRPGVAHVQIEGLTVMDRLLIKRGLAGLER